jgi:hypothetical protein
LKPLYEVGNKKPPKAHYFKKGNPGGPGRPKVSRAEVILRKITAQDVAEIGQMIIMGDLPALKDVLARAEHENPEMRPTTLQVWIAACAAKAIKEGDSRTLNDLLDRFVGRIPAALLIANVPSKDVTMTPEEAQEEAKRLLLEAARD